MSNADKAVEYKNLGNQAFKNKKYDQAIKLFSQAIECNPNDHVLFSNRSGSYLNAGNYQTALQDAESCLKINPTWARGYQRKGAALFYLNKIDEAITTYEQGLKHDPENKQLKDDLKNAQDKQMSAQQGLLQAYLKLANHPETKQYLSDPQFMQKVQALIQNPALFTLFQNDPKVKKAYQVINEGGMPGNFDFEELLRNMEKKQEPKFKAHPKSEEKHEQKKEENTTMEDEAASPKKQQKAEPKKQQPKKQQPKEADPAEDAKNEGNNQYKKKNFEKAIELYQKAIDLKPNEPLYYNNKAAALIEIGKFAQAHAELDKADKIFEDLKDYVKKGKVLARRASLFAKEGKYDESISTYQKSLLEDGVQKVRDQLKTVQKMKKQKQDKDYLNPELAEKACQAGNALFKEGKFPAALKEYEEAIKRNPNSAKYYSNLGTVYIKLMEWQRAKENFDIALKKDPAYIKAYPKKGDCHFAMKQYHKALEIYEAGLKIDPQNQLCKTGLVKTQQAIYTSGGASTEEQKMQRAKRAMADPEIQQILNTPEVRNALADLQNNPSAIQGIMSNPSLAAKIEKLIQAGVIGTG